MPNVNAEKVLSMLTRRYGRIDQKALIAILCPALIPIDTLDRRIYKERGRAHYRAGFSLRITEQNEHLMQKGRTGKFVPKSYVEGSVWNELAKGRLLEIDWSHRIAHGEVYIGSSSRKADLEEAVTLLTEDDYLEVDQFGASAKVLSSLVEYAFAAEAKKEGFIVRRMPEDTAKHVGEYYHYDYEIECDGSVKKVEVKSLWGTNTQYARLIRSKTKDNPTSSYRFDTQDIFAVNLFLRTGSVYDFAYARSVPVDEKPYGLPRATKYPTHVNQNPPCSIGDGSWFGTLQEVCDLD